MSMNSEPLKQATLIFLRREDEVLLAMKKRGFGEGRWNGVGGKVEAGETLEQAAKRECHEEIGVMPKKLGRVAVLDFMFPQDPTRPNWNQQVTVFVSREWDGKPKETEEMAPKWFKLEQIPYDEMWSDDKLWLPQVLAGQTLRGSFSFNEDSSVKSYKLEDGLAS